MNTFTYYFNTAFPIKVKFENNFTENKLITKGLIISRNKLRLLHNIKRTTSLSIEASKLPTDLQESGYGSKKEEADRYVLSSSRNKNKAMWKLINRESGKTQQACNVVINIRDKTITNPQSQTDLTLFLQK